MNRIRLVTLALLGVIIPVSFLTGFATQKQESLITPLDTRGWEMYPAGQTPPDRTSTSPSRSTPSTLSNPVPNAIANPSPSVATFNFTFVRRPMNLIFYDAGTDPNDGDIVEISLNGQIVRAGLLLTDSGTVVKFDKEPYPNPVDPNANSRPRFSPGVNQIRVRAIGIGTTGPINTLGIIILSNENLTGSRIERTFPLVSDASVITTVGFPQIAICKTIFRFPCRTSGISLFPESAEHALEAQGVPPQPILAALKPGRTGNPLRVDGYPRLLTVDRPGKDRRGVQSTSAYASCPSQSNGRPQDRDEYPPKIFLENGVLDPISNSYLGSAHIKCIWSYDNQQAGNSFKLQLDNYREQPSGISYFIGNDYTIEFVILN